MRVTTGVAAWLVAAAAATTVGLFAVGAIGTDIFGASTGQPLSQSEVDAKLARSTPATTPPATTTTSPPPASSSAAPPPVTTTTPRPQTGRTQSFRSAGGTVFARCAPGGVEVVSATPAQGFSVDSENEGVDDHPHVRFRSGEREVEVRLRCVGGTVQPTYENK
jgi:hypothetical protein